MLTKPFNIKINEKFCDKIRFEIDSVFLEEIKKKIKSLLEYDNFALTFYHGELSFFCNNAQKFVVFGYDLEGFFVIDADTKRVFHLSDGVDGDELTPTLTFCNTDIDLFIKFNNLFISIALTQAEFSDENHSGSHEDEGVYDAMESNYNECDPLAMNVDNFWNRRSYELRDDFFPLNSSRIDFYEDMLVRLDLDKHKKIKNDC